ncbi:hypothetical protein HDU84_007456 [Entophlyctis sp. JEL0112]|nr:hypothetical protein HDU84_007456 [Entophlyctis sp. JEL0112]
MKCSTSAAATLASVALMLALWAAARFLHALVVVLTRALPAYFHVLLLVNLGLLCWASNIHLLILAGINPNRLLNFHQPLDLYSVTHTHFSHQLVLIPSNLYKLCAVFSALTLVAVVGFGLLVRISNSEETAEIVPLLAYIIALLLLVGRFGEKGEGFFGKERKWFLGSLSRIAFGGLLSPVPFCDVIFADILTSFSRVLGELHLVAQDLLSYQGNHETRYSADKSPTSAQGRNVVTVTFGTRAMEIIGVFLVW